MSDFLIIQAARFGDLVQSKRLVMSLQKQGTVHLAVDRSLTQLAAILYPFAVIHALDFHGSPHFESILANRKVFLTWSDINFTKVYNCNFSSLTAAICRMFPPDIIIGNRPARDFDGGIERSPWSRLVSRLSGMRQVTPLNLVDYWAYFVDKPLNPELVNPPARAGGGGLGIVVAGRESRRSLPAQVLARITETVFRLLKGPPIKLLGSVREDAAAQRLVRHFNRQLMSRTSNLCGKTDWAQLCAEVGNLDLLLTPDTGIMHLAAHFGVPIMAFFLSSAWCHETGPYGVGHIIWQATTACAPCLESAPCPHKVACLEALKAGDFGRSLAWALGGNEISIAQIPGLQCFNTDVDDFGAICRPIAGEDAFAAKRQNIRALLRDYAGLPAEINPAHTSPGAYASLVASLFPDDEWALPPWRYV